MNAEFFIVNFMALTKQQKQKTIDDLKDKVARQKSIVFTDFTGLKVKDLSDLRKKLKATDSELKIAKKTLMRIVLKKAKIEITEKDLPGEVALVFGYKDEISVAKTVHQFAETNPNLKILGGFFGNKIRIKEEIVALAQLPGKEQLLAKIVGSVQAPISNLVYSLQFNLKGLINVLAKAKT